MKKIVLFLLLFMVYGTALTPLLAQNNEHKSPSNNDGRTTKLLPQVRVIEREYIAPILKMEMVQHFLPSTFIVTKEELNNAGQIVANTEPSIFATQGSRIYVSHLGKGTVEDQYVIMRLGQTYHNSSSEEEEGEILGYEGIYLGEAVLKVPGEPATLDIISANREIKNGDRLLLMKERDFFEDFPLHSPETLEETYIIATNNGTLSFGQYQIVVINKGSNENIERGYVLAVNKRSHIINRNFFDREIQLPRQRVGTLLIFRVFDHISYALVMEASMPLNLFDIVTAP